MKSRLFNIKSLALLVAGITILSVSLYLPVGTTVSGADEVKTEEPASEPLPPPAEQHSTGYNPHLTDLPPISGDSFPTPARRTLLYTALPPSFDWRNKDGQNYVTSVKDQGGCGSCYAFATVGNLEAKILIDGGTTLDLSENNAKECNARELLLSQNDGTPSDTWNNCAHGGNATMVINLFTQKGAVLEADDPYSPTDGTCNTYTHVKTVLDWRVISHNAVADTTVLKQYIQNYGPVFTALYAFPAFKSYIGTGTLSYSGPEEPDHAVLIVGWDDTRDGGAWIVKNSWGTSHGDNGYFYITYGSAQIGFDSSVITAVQDYDSNGSLLYYDEGGLNGTIYAGTESLWGLVKYIPATNTNVTRVEFWTAEATTDVDIYLYDSFNGANLTNLLTPKENLSFPEAGYHSVILDTPLPVTSGNDVYVAVKFTKAGDDNFEIAVDYDGPIKGVGYSYFSINGTTWNDTYEHCDVGIRLRTQNALPPVANFTASSTIITAGQSVTFTNNSTGTITSQSWNFGDGGTSTDQNPSHTYTTAGTFNVSLTVTGPGGTDVETKNGYITVNPDALHHVTVTPNPAYVLPSAQQQFTATGYDQYNNAISGLSWSWIVVNSGGTIDSNGLFTAGATRGVYLNTVQASSDGKSGTATVIVGASMTVTATLQGDSRTLAGMNVPFTLKIYSEAVNIGNITSLVPVDTFTTTTGDIEITGKEVSTKVVTLKVGRLPTGIYHVTLFTPHSLVNYKANVSIPPGGTVNMGTLLEGDAQDISEDSTSINITDFNRFAQAYETIPTSLKWDARADFNEDDYINLSDFTLLYTNYGKTSPQTVTD